MQQNMTNDSAKPIKKADSDRSQPIDITTRLRQTRANMLGTDDEQHYWDCHEAADEIERLRTIMYRVVDEDCTIAVQGGAILADDEVVCRVARAAHEMAGTATACTAEADTTQPRNGAVCTPSTQTTPGECSTHGDGT